MSTPNPVLQKLGLSASDRAVILHADDIGNFQSSLAAYRELVDDGLISSASVMVPCPWFPAAAEFCRSSAGHPNLDMGVHLTVTSEWDRYRWGPVASREKAGGLLDEDGYFHSSAEAFQAHAAVEATRVELQAQIDRALAAGIDVTHIDTHMGALLHPKFIDSYIELALAYRVPVFLLRSPDPHLSHDAYDTLLPRVPEWEERGLPLFDQATMMPLDDAADRSGQLLRRLQALKPGLSYIMLHPTKDTPELREAASESDWPCRVADYQTFGDPAVREAVRATGVHVIGFRALRDLMRAGGDR